MYKKDVQKKDALTRKIYESEIVREREREWGKQTIMKQKCITKKCFKSKSLWLRPSSQRLQHHVDI